MNKEMIMSEHAERKMSSIFERYLTVWVALSIVVGIALGKLLPDLAKTLDGVAISVNGAPWMNSSGRGTRSNMK